MKDRHLIRRAAPWVALALLGCSTSEGEGNGATAEEPAMEGTEPSGEVDSPASGTGSDGACPLAFDAAELPSGALALRRGFNLGNRLDAPTEGAWAPRVREQDLQSIAARGFDHVRLPVRASSHAAAEAPFTLSCELLSRMDELIGQTLGLGLSVVIDVHHYEELMREPAAHRERFIAIWRQLAERYAALPEGVAFELLNEPQGALDAAWNELASEALAVVRESNPTRRVIVDAQNFGRFQSLSRETAETGAALELPAGDPSLMAGAHVYEPSAFCFQGTAFSGPIFGTEGIVFPGPPPEPLEPVDAARSETWLMSWFQSYNELPASENPASARALGEMLDLAVAFRERTGYDVYVGEVCTAWRADVDSRVRYLTALREALAERELGWAVWDTAGQTDLWSPERGSWLEPVTSALIEQL